MIILQLFFIPEAIIMHIHIVSLAYIGFIQDKQIRKVVASPRGPAIISEFLLKGKRKHIIRVITEEIDIVWDK
jgi:hypothetical protein